MRASPINRALLLLGAWYLLLLGTAPWALFAERYSTACSCIVLFVATVPYAAGRAMCGKSFAATPLDGVIAALVGVLVPLSMLSSPLRWEVTFPRTVCLLWSVSLYYAVTAGVRRSAARGSLLRPLFVLFACAVVPSLVSLMALQRGEKFGPIEAIVRHLPDYSVALFHRPGGAQSNELAGMLTLAVPASIIAAAGIWRRGGQTRAMMPARIASLSFAVFFSAAMVLTQSRGGWLACGVALVFSLAWFGRKGFLVIAGTIVSAGAVVFLAFPWFREVFLMPSSLMGLSAQSVLSGRPGVWRLAFILLSASPYLGAGLGTFSRLTSAITVQSVESPGFGLADAHSLPLQTAIDFGMGGVLALIVALWIVARHGVQAVRHTDREGLERVLRVGMLAGVLAFAVFNVADAVSFGSRAGMLLWMFLGCAMTPAATVRDRGSTVAPAVSTTRARRARWIVVPVLALSACVCGLLSFTSAPSLRGSWSALGILRCIDAGTGADSVQLSSAGREGGHAGLWLIGMYRHRRNETGLRDSVWTALLELTPEYIQEMQNAAPTDTALARRAVALQSADARPYFWLGFLTMRSDSVSAERLLRTCVGIDPGHGLAWRYLGDALRFKNPRGAIDAYLQSCLHGDPGANGCYLAGTAEESLGEYQAAIRYYRMSRWRTAQLCADRLERMLAQHATP
jgi:O-antigen ligase